MSTTNDLPLSMRESHLYRAMISSIPEGELRPLWSVMIPTHNCANYLRETLASVLAQAPGPEVMQIEVIDDCSTKDDPKAVVEELGQGRVGFYRQLQNVGYIANFETCLLRSRGQLIHLLHGDDCLKDGFYRKLQAAFETHPEIGAAFCRHAYIDEDGHDLGMVKLEQLESGILDNWLERIAVEQRIQTPSIVVRRAVYEQLGGFDRRFTCCGEDWEMWVRLAAQYPVWYEVEPLALYRMRSASLSRMSTRTGADIRDLRMACEMIRSHLPATASRRLFGKARENVALYAIRYLAFNMLTAGNLMAARIQIQEALKCSCSPKVMEELMYLILRSGKLWIKKAL